MRAGEEIGEHMTEADFPAAAIAGAVAAAKGLLRLEGGGEDAVLARLAAAALGLAEAFLGQRLVARAFEDRVEGDGAWRRLAAEPVTAIAADGVAVDIGADGVGWVRATGGVVAVGYTAGLADGWDALPPAIRQGVALLVQHLFEHREGAATPPAAIAALWRPWRRMRLAESRR